jgi:hypothetical protein
MADSTYLKCSHINNQSVDLTSSNPLKATYLRQSRDFFLSGSPQSSDDFCGSTLYARSEAFPNSLTDEESILFQGSFDFADSSKQVSQIFGHSTDFEVSAEGNRSASYEESNLNHATEDLVSTNHFNTSMPDQSSSMNSTIDFEKTLRLDFSDALEGSQLLKATNVSEESSSLVSSEQIRISSMMSESNLLAETSHLNNSIAYQSKSFADSACFEDSFYYERSAGENESKGLCPSAVIDASFELRGSEHLAVSFGFGNSDAVLNSKEQVYSEVYNISSSHEGSGISDASTHLNDSDIPIGTNAHYESKVGNWSGEYSDSSIYSPCQNSATAPKSSNARLFQRIPNGY